MADQSLRVPVWCPLCSCIMKGKSTNSFMDFGVCINCKIFFIEGREARWKSGWRPSTQEVDDYVKALYRSET